MVATISFCRYSNRQDYSIQSLQDGSYCSKHVPCGNIPLKDECHEVHAPFSEGLGEVVEAEPEANSNAMTTMA